jgi:hypothetical protein
MEDQTNAPVQIEEIVTVEEQEVASLPIATQPLIRKILAVLTILLALIAVGLGFYVDGKTGIDDTGRFPVFGPLSLLNPALLIAAIGVGVFSLRSGTLPKLLIAAGIVFCYIYVFKFFFF